MDFAKKQLEKYGWREGKGLGKNEDGISAALKPKLKFDNSGVGHEVGKEFTNNWWERVYNSALDNVEVDSKAGDVKVQVKDEESVEITTKNYSVRELKKKNNGLEYQGTFIKTSKLTENGLVNFGKAEKEGESSAEVPTFSAFQPLTDEELFAACGGRTAHKGARHGLKLSGKLSRIEKQEKMLLKKLKNVSLNDNRENLEKKIKKISISKERLGGDIEDNISRINNDELDSRSSGSVTPKKKSKNRKKRSVSFSETVTSYTTIEDVISDKFEVIPSDNSNGLDIFKYTVVKVVKIQEAPEKSAVRNLVQAESEGPDEGIEQDCEARADITNHKSFELVQNIEEKLKKIARLKKQDGATKRFLRKLAEHEKKDSSHVVDSCHSCLKRKNSIKVEITELESSQVPAKKLKVDVGVNTDIDIPSKSTVLNKMDKGSGTGVNTANKTDKKVCTVVNKADKSIGTVVQAPNKADKKEKKKEEKRLLSKKERKELKAVRSITKSLNKNCRISESD